LIKLREPLETIEPKSKIITILSGLLFQIIKTTYMHSKQKLSHRIDREFKKIFRPLIMEYIGESRTRQREFNGKESSDIIDQILDKDKRVREMIDLE
jgi:hypothetical protein